MTNVIPDKIALDFPELELVRMRMNSLYEWRGQTENFTVKKLDENLLFRKGRVLNYDSNDNLVDGVEFFIVISGIDLPIMPVEPLYKTPRTSNDDAKSVGEVVHNFIPFDRTFYVVQVDFSFSECSSFAEYTIYKTDHDSGRIVLDYFNNLFDWEHFTPQK